MEPLALAEGSSNPQQRDEADKSSPSSRLDTPSGKKVAYYYDHDVGNYDYGNSHPMKPARARITYNLLVNYDVLKYMDVIRPTRATPFQMTKFHSDEYIDFLATVTPETVNELTGGGQRFFTGAKEDCPPFEGVFELCSVSAGGSIGSATRLNDGMADTCINWSGGLHHAKKTEASGFCYVNDIVLAILELLRYHERVLYIDIDVHHGDGVEEAFYSTDRVMTCSVHKFGDFFPGTGHVNDMGIGKGKGYSVNVPLRDGINDESYKSIFEPVISKIVEWYRPGVIILQCGADSLAGDKLGPFNLSMKGHASCVEFVGSLGLPMMVLGGGGYTTKNVARTWAYETGLVLGKQLEENLPYNDYLEYFGPRYKLEVPESNMEDQNSREYLEGLKSTIFENLKNMPFAPSVQMQHVPSTTVSKEIGLEDDIESDAESSVDGSIRNRIRRIEALASGNVDVDDEDEDMMGNSDDEGSGSVYKYRTGYQQASTSRLHSKQPQFFSNTNSRYSIHSSKGKSSLYPASSNLFSSTPAHTNGSSKKRRFFSSSKLEKLVSNNSLIANNQFPNFDNILFPTSNVNNKLNHRTMVTTTQINGNGGLPSGIQTPVEQQQPFGHHEFAPQEFLLEAGGKLRNWNVGAVAL